MTVKVKKISRETYQRRICKECGKSFVPRFPAEIVHYECREVYFRRYWRDYRRKMRKEMKEESERWNSHEN